MEKSSVENQIESIVEQIRSLNNEIVRIKNKSNQMSDQFNLVLDDFVELNQKLESFPDGDFLERIIVVENGEKKRKTVGELLIGNYKVIEPIRFLYDFINFLKRHPIIKLVFFTINILFTTSFLGFILTGKGFLQLIGFLK